VTKEEQQSTYRRPVVTLAAHSIGIRRNQIKSNQPNAHQDILQSVDTDIKARNTAM
jgi:hypothetical protein